MPAQPKIEALLPPTSPEELAKRNDDRRAAGTKKPPAPSRCRQCGATETIPRYEYFRASRPRCKACGGTMDYLGSWRKTR